MWHTGNLTTLNILSSLHRRFFPFDFETIIMKNRGKILMTVKLWVKQALDKTRSCNKMHLHFTVAKVVTYSQQNVLKHSLALHLIFAKSISKNGVYELHFWSFSNLIFTACVACKIQLRNRPKVSLHFLKSIFQKSSADQHLDICFSFDCMNAWR